MHLDIYLNYPGNCEEAFRFYERELGAKVLSIQRHSEAPGSTMPPEWMSKVLHAQLDFGNVVLMGADVPSAQPMRSAYVTLGLDSVEEAERVYKLLAEGGQIFMKMEETFFATRFAMLRDRFGTSWMLLYRAPLAGGRN